MKIMATSARTIDKVHADLTMVGFLMISARESSGGATLD
jgi:hypothetical protein